MSASRSPSLGNIHGYDKSLTLFTIIQQRIMHLNSRLLINGNEMIDNDVDIWNFMRTLMDIQ